MSAPWLDRSAAEIAAGVREGKVTGKAMVEDCFARQHEVRVGADGLNCLLAADRDASLRELERKPVGGKLAGVPV
ncbi:MAG: hypothetical protein HYR75_02765, partial [Gemmatimonadetes bacterium]|nr:hypothetical protein [Gemmatimonadota bacterium]